MMGRETTHFIYYTLNLVTLERLTRNITSPINIFTYSIAGIASVDDEQRF
jgi:hypothetical protein